MKSHVFLASALICAAALTGCDSKTRLAQAVQGEWSSTPEILVNTGAARATMVRVMEFSRSGQATEGTVTMTALVTVENTIPSNDSIVTPISISASGNATITGIYTVKDDDEINVSLDASSLAIAVDPDAVTLDYNVLSGQSAPELDKLRPGALRLATQQIGRAAQEVFYNLTEIDDIRVDNDLMSCEIGHKDLTFRREVPRP